MKQPSAPRLAPVARVPLVAALVAALSWSGAGCSKKSSSQSVRVVRTEPSGGSTDVNPNTTVTVVFSASMQESTINTGSFIVRGSASGSAPGNYAYNDAERQATFQPSRIFADGEEVTVELKDSIRGRSGAFLSERSFSFRIRPAVVPPPPPPPPPAASVSKRLPFPHSIAQRDPTIYVEFSERMNPLTFSSDTVRVETDLRGRVQVTIGDIAITGTRVAILPSRPFLPGEWVTVRLSASIRTQSNGEFPGDVFSFRAAFEPPGRVLKPGPVFEISDLAVGPLQLADLNGDNRIDIVHAPPGAKAVNVLEGLFEARFAEAGLVDVGRDVLSIHLMDLNQDNRLDLLVGSSDRVQVFLGQSVAFTFLAGETIPIGAAVWEISSGDLNHQGLLEVVLDTDRGLRVYQDGLSGAPALTVGDARQTRTELQLRDLNLDGFLDLLYGDAAGNQLTFRPGGAAALLGEGQAIALGGSPLWLRVENLDQDSALEIVVQTASAQSAQLEFPSLPPAGGQAGEENLEPLGAEAERRYALADLDANGLPDLLALDAAGGAVLSFMNVDGTFDLNAPQTLAQGFTSQAALGGDFTGDGVLDLVFVDGKRLRAFVSEGQDDPPPPPPATSLTIDPIEAKPGDTGKQASVLLTSNVSVEGYTIVMAFNKSAMVVDALTLEGTATAVLLPEFIAPNIDADAGFLTMAVSFDLLPPFEARALEPASRANILTVNFHVPANAVPGVYALDLKDDLGVPPLSNTLVHEAISIHPDLTDGTLTITPLSPPPTANKLTVVATSAVKGAKGVKVPILISCDQDVDAFSVVATYDTAVLTVTGFNSSGTAVGDVGAEFVIPSIRASESFFAYTVIFDFSPPFDRQHIPPAQNQKLIEVLVDVDAGAPLGDSLIDLKNDLGDPPLANSFVANNTSVFPDLFDGPVTVVDVPPPPPSKKFIRGDINASQRIDISDFVYLIEWMYHQGPQPPCKDAADLDDNGVLALADGVRLLDYMFKGTPVPSAPFPSLGVDPTLDDGLDCINGQ